MQSTYRPLPVKLVLLLLQMLPAFCKHNERPTGTGFWKIPTGFRAYHLDTPLATAIASLLGRGARDLSVLDMGAGKGLYVRMLRTVGLRNVTGYEGVANIEYLTSGRIKRRDFTIPFEPCKRFDVVVCLEVAEHIPPRFESTFLSNVNCSAGSGLVISWAPPGQSGTGHVNLQSRKDALARLTALGFELDTMATRHISEQATLYWFKKNTLALRRKGQPSPFQAPVRLVADARSESDGLAAAEAAAARDEAARGLRAAAPALNPLAAEPLARALDRIRAGYAKLEARLDELQLTGSGAPKVDVLLQNALSEQHRGFDDLAQVGRPLIADAEAKVAAAREDGKYAGR